MKKDLKQKSSSKITNLYNRGRFLNEVKNFANKYFMFPVLIGAGLLIATSSIAALTIIGISLVVAPLAVLAGSSLLKDYYEVKVNGLMRERERQSELEQQAANIANPETEQIKQESKVNVETKSRVKHSFEESQDSLEKN